MALCFISSGDLFLTKELLEEVELRGIFENAPYVIFAQIGEKEPKFSCYDETVTSKTKLIHAESAIDTIFKLKKCLDEEKVVSCTIYTPEVHVSECSAVKELLFVETFDVSVRGLSVPGFLKRWGTDSCGRDCSKDVKEYLTTVPSREDIKVIQSNLLPSDAFVHGFTTRYGGISFYPSQASMSMVYSLSKTDSRLVIEENRRRLCAHIGRNPAKFNMAKAVHGNSVWVYEKPPLDSYDGIVTCTPGVTIASPAADCNMVLLADPVKKCCGSMHAGWKGILVGALPAIVAAMVKEYGSNPKDILCCLGPSLSVCCLEFGAEDSKKFLSISDDIVIWKTGAEKPHIDIRLAAKIQLESSGIKPENIDDGLGGARPTPALATCTKCDPTKSHFSYRRDGAKFGNGAGYISLR